MKQNVYEMTTPSPARGRIESVTRRGSPQIHSRQLAKAAWAGVCLLVTSSALAADSQAAAAVSDQSSGSHAIGLGLVGVAVGLSILGAGHAVGRIGSAALGAISEKPEMLARALMFAALGEGLAVLGFAFAMLLLHIM
jgi:V/A-type H+/Na+-transporting ATPase subunit K